MNKPFSEFLSQLLISSSKEIGHAPTYNSIRVVVVADVPELCGPGTRPIPWQKAQTVEEFEKRFSSLKRDYSWLNLCLYGVSNSVLIIGVEHAISKSNKPAHLLDQCTINLRGFPQDADGNSNFSSIRLV